MAEAPVAPVGEHTGEEPTEVSPPALEEAMRCTFARRRHPQRVKGHMRALMTKKKRQPQQYERHGKAAYLGASSSKSAVVVPVGFSVPSASRAARSACNSQRILSVSSSACKALASAS